MKKISIFLILCLMTIISFAQGIQFEQNHNLQDALNKAKSQNKLVFIDAYASWCGPCKMMAARIFPLKDVGDYYNANFVNLKLDMEAPENLEIAKKYGVQAYPTYLFLNPQGDLVHKGLGAMPAEEFLKVGMTAIDPNNNSQALMDKIKKGDRSFETLNKYFGMNPYDKGNGILADEYFKALNDDQKYSNDAWNLFTNYIQNPKSEIAQYFFKNKDKYIAKFGKEEVDNKIFEFIGNAYRSDKANFETYKSLDAAIFNQVKSYIQLSEAQRDFKMNPSDKPTWEKFMKLIPEFLQNNKKVSSQTLNNFAWTVYENYKNFNDKNALKNALSWAKKAYELSPDQDFILDTYAHLLYDTGKKKEAVEIESKALELAKKANNQEAIDIYTKTIIEFNK